MYSLKVWRFASFFLLCFWCKQEEKLSRVTPEVLPTFSRDVFPPSIKLFLSLTSAAALNKTPFLPLPHLFLPPSVLADELISIPGVAKDSAVPVSCGTPQRSNPSVVFPSSFFVPIEVKVTSRHFAVNSEESFYSIFKHQHIVKKNNKTKMTN